MKDKLQVMFEAQKYFQTKLGIYDKIKNESDKQLYVNQMILACQEECVEIMRETAYKNPKFVKFGWKQKQVWNTGNYKSEIIDLMHFVMNLWFVAFLEENRVVSSASEMADEFFAAYCNKHNINEERQKSGY